MREKIPTAYKIYHERILRNSFNGRIEKEKANKILSWFFHIPKEKTSKILHEMYELGLLEFNSNHVVEVKQPAVKVC